MTWCRLTVSWTPMLEKQLARKGLSLGAENHNQHYSEESTSSVFIYTMMTPPNTTNYNKDGSPEADDLSWVLLEKKKACGRQGWSGRNLQLRDRTNKRKTNAVS